MADKKPTGLTPAELQELQELEELEQLEALERAGKLEAPQAPEGKSPVLAGAQKGLTFGFSDELAGAAGALGGKFGGDPRSLSDIYREAQQSYLQEEQAIEKESPGKFLLGQVGGGFLIPGAGMAKGATLGAKVAKTAGVGAAQGALQGAGEAATLSDIPSDVAEKGLLGAVLGAALPVAGVAGGKAVQKMRGGAEKLAQAATGASGEVARKAFKPGTGEYLLKSGIVSAGDTVESIAQKAAAKKEEAGAVMGNLIRQAETSGASARAADLIKEIDTQMALLKPDASKASVMSQLESIKQNILAAANGNVNNPIPPTLLETTKQGFQSGANYLVPGMDEAQKIVAGIYKNEGERLVQQALPDQALAFKAAKDEFGLLSPVAEAAEKRSAQLDQAQALGLLDVTSAGAGAAALGPLGAVAGPILQRQIRARGLATGAAALNVIPRTVDGIKAALPQIAETNPQLAAAIMPIINLPKERAVRMLAPIISQFGDDQLEPSEYPSLFEGKLYDEQDKQAYSNKLKDELPPIERAKALSALNKDGSVLMPPQAPKTPAVAPQTPVKRLTTSDLANNTPVPKKDRPY